MGFPRLDYLEVTSTLDIAREQARRGAPHGTLITAVHQSAGRGRRGAAWHDGGGSTAAAASDAGAAANALLTFILRGGESDLPLRDVWRIPFIASLACCGALRELGFGTAQVKWPNDLVMGGKKVGGLLVESFSGQADAERSAESERAFLLGIGINVGQTDFTAGRNYALAPTSLQLEHTGEEAVPNAVEVTSQVTARLEQAWREHLRDGAALIDAWRAYQMTGQPQTGIDLATGKLLAGRYQDVRASDGAALVLIDDTAGATAALMPTR